MSFISCHVGGGGNFVSPTLQDQRNTSLTYDGYHSPVCAVSCSQQLASLALKAENSTSPLPQSVELLLEVKMNPSLFIGKVGTTAFS